MTFGQFVTIMRFVNKNVTKPQRKEIFMKKFAYTHSLILLFLFALIAAPATVYAQEELSVLLPFPDDTPPDTLQPFNDASASADTVPDTMQTLNDSLFPADASSATVQALTGTALSADMLPSSLIEELYTYLVDSFTMGIIDADKYNQILNSGMVSENAFFENSVFVGDSITVGFEQYCENHSDSIKTDTTYFLARVSCSARVAISENALTKHSNIMPVYNGKSEYIENAIAQMTDVNKAFICFGVNDLGITSPDGFIQSMQTLISRILEKRPDVKIYVISVPCVMSNVSSNGLNNHNIQIANILLQNMCQTSGWGYINLSEYLMDSQMGLKSEYTSDNYVHENNKAYAVWNKVLKEYAFSEIIK